MTGTLFDALPTEKQMRDANKPLSQLVLRLIVERAPEHGAICTDVVRWLRETGAPHHEHGTVSKRLSELSKALLIRPAGPKRRSPWTDQLQTPYVATDAGRKAVA